MRNHYPLLLGLLALLLFSLLFAGVGGDFWMQLAGSAFLLCALALWVDKDGQKALCSPPPEGWGRSAFFGLLSAALLYLVFMTGGALARRIMGFAADQIDSVYTLKAGRSPWLMGTLIALIIGPGEEIFWRGYLQRKLHARYGIAGSVIAVLAYAGAHIASLNLMLIVAALVCGIFWGLLYARFKSIWLNIISHVAGDLAVFLVLPLSS
jgi:membrane protease YdiL (CAAX protease family)